MRHGDNEHEHERERDDEDEDRGTRTKTKTYQTQLQAALSPRQARAAPALHLVRPLLRALEGARVLGDALEEARAVGGLGNCGGAGEEPFAGDEDGGAGSGLFTV